MAYMHRIMIEAVRQLSVGEGSSMYLLSGYVLYLHKLIIWAAANHHTISNNLKMILLKQKIIKMEIF